MSKYQQFQVTGLDDYSLDSRPSKVTVDHFAETPRDSSISSFARSLPRILAANDLRTLCDLLIVARREKRALIWGFGGHVIKVGLAPILIELMDKGFITAMATNGSGMIHDFEIAWAGHTSEEVESVLGQGAFGMARETGVQLNQAVNEGMKKGLGIGESVGRHLDESPIRYPEKSVFLQAFRRNIPCTVHMALGTDIIHNHPSASGAALGEGSMVDFRILTQEVCGLDGGGVYLNLGSAVILPEVFLKAVSLVRNSGRRLKDFSTANFDFIQHYRPIQNVIKRPLEGSGRGIALTGHHEIMIPLLAALLLDRLEG